VAPNGPRAGAELGEAGAEATALASRGGGARLAASGGGRFEPTLYLYDAVAGGTGLAPRLWEERRVLLERSARLVAACPCEAGCPSCVGPVVGTPEAGRRRVLLEIWAALGLDPSRREARGA
jgi:DEAD/DEAH box helicase domain-containing protein